MAIGKTGGGAPVGPSRPVTVLCDPRNDRAAMVGDVVVAAGGDLASRLGPALAGGIPPGTWIGLVALGGDSLPAASELALIRRLGEARVRVIAYGDGANAWPLGVRCGILLAGAVVVLDSARPAFANDLQAKVEQALATESARRVEQDGLRATFRSLGIVGESDAMLGIFRWAVRVSGLSDLHVLITGETGTGKQLVAEAVHALDPKRRNGPFVALNCSAISPALVESELFGHRRGAFTGADRDRKGLIRAADGGVLFLDEVGELDPALQAKLLRVLQDQRVLAVGEDHESPISVRVIAATNRDLEELVRQRTFRADLFHRLNILSIHVPPIRERAGDIAPLVAHFLSKHAELARSGPLTAADDFIAALARGELPGNVRQLENLVRLAIVQKEDGEALSLVDLPSELWASLATAGSDDELATGGPEDPAAMSASTSGSSDADDLAPHSYASHVLELNGWNLSRSLASCERSLVAAALEATEGNQSETARLLGITPRSVYNKLRKHQLLNDRSASRTNVPEPPFRASRLR